MFFDTQGADDTYRKLLLQVAETQRALLEKSFNWKERLEIPVPQKRGFFGRKPKADPAREELLAHLESVKAQIRRHRRSGAVWEGSSGGACPGSRWRGG